MTNQKLRQAWQAALDIEPIMKTVAGGQSRVLPHGLSLSFQEMPAWHTKIPGLPWNEHNKDKAKRLLQEAGYKGEPIRFMTTQEYKWMYDFALVSKQQLEDVGFNDRSPGGGLGHPGQAAQQPEGVRRLHHGHGRLLRPDPPLYPHAAAGRAGPATRRSRRSDAQLARETDPKKRYALWEQQTRLFYEKVPVIRYGDLFGLRAARKTVRASTRRPSARGSGACGWRSSVAAARARRGAERRRACPGRRDHVSPSPPDGAGARARRGAHRRLHAHPPHPGRPGQRHAGPVRDDRADRGTRRDLGLDRPLPEQLVRFYARIGRGDLGHSYFLNRPVTTTLWERAEPTLALTLSALLVAVAIGVPAGIVAGANPGSALDRFLMLGALLGVCVPGFWLSLNFIYLFAVRLGWLPAGGTRPSGRPVGRAPLHGLPALSLGFNQSALIARITRSCMIEVLRRTTSAPREPRGCPSAPWSTSTPSATRWSRWSPSSGSPWPS